MNLFIWLGNKIGGWLSKPEPKETQLGSASVREAFHTAHDRAVGEREQRRMIYYPAVKLHAAQRAKLAAEIARRKKAKKAGMGYAHLQRQLEWHTAKQLECERLWECG